MDNFQIEPKTGADYSALQHLEETARKNNFKFEFDFLSKIGFDHIPIFHYELAVFNQNGEQIGTAKGSGSSKRLAKQAAAHAFLMKTNVQVPNIDDSMNAHGNAIGKLLEYCVKNSFSKPIFHITRTRGEAIFECQCTMENFVTHGQHRSKKGAKHHSALLALQKLKHRDALKLDANGTDGMSSKHSTEEQHNEEKEEKNKEERAIDGETLKFKQMSTFANNELTFSQDGAEILYNIVCLQAALKISEVIGKYIELFSMDIECTPDEYMANVNYWQHPSELTDTLLFWVSSALKMELIKIMGKDICLHNTIVMKGNNVTIPCHQDASYLRYPYDISIWIQLSVGGHDSLDYFEILPKSHKENVDGAIDYHDPNFVDNIHLSSEWQTNAICLSLKPGQALVLSPRTKYRFAGAPVHSTCHYYLITHWNRTSAGSNTPKTIDKNDTLFGIWTDDLIIADILHRGLGFLLQPQEEIKCTLIDCVNEWLRLLSMSVCDASVEKRSRSFGLPGDMNAMHVTRLLSALKILYRTGKRHNGSDCSGNMYKTLWSEFLIPLSNFLDRSTID